MTSLPMTTFYKHVPVDIPYSYMKHVVGKKGHYFKKCKETTGVDSVWYNVKRNVVEIYGPSNKLESASTFLEKKLESARKKVPKEELADFQSKYVKSVDTCVSGSLEGALTKEQIKYLIGKKGKHFKKITKEANVSFIWYDESNHTIVIWGPPEYLENAVRILFQHIEKIKNTTTTDIEMQD